VGDGDFGKKGFTISTFGAGKRRKKNWSTCTRIRCRENWSGMRRTGHGAVGRFMWAEIVDWW